MPKAILSRSAFPSKAADVSHLNLGWPAHKSPLLV